MATLAIPKDSLILVTGANSLQGSRLVDQLLAHGYRVRGTVRDESKASQTTAYFSSKYGSDRYSATIVPSMETPEAFDNCMQDISGVVHVASNTTFSPSASSVIEPSIRGAVNALAAAAKYTSVSRFVYCSSVSAAASPSPDTAVHVTSDTWNRDVIARAWRPEPHPQNHSWDVYMASKASAEMEVWRWCRERRPEFVLNTVCPDVLYGRVLDPASSGWPSTSGMVKAFYDGNTTAGRMFPNQWFVDVRDSARIHVAALIYADVKDERIFAVAERFVWNDILAALRVRFPHRTIPADLPNMRADRMTFDEGISEPGIGATQEAQRRPWRRHVHRSAQQSNGELRWV